MRPTQRGTPPRLSPPMTPPWGRHATAYGAVDEDANVRVTSVVGSGAGTHGTPTIDS